MIIKRIKLAAIALFVLPALFVAALKTTPTAVLADPVDPATTYKAKCAMCHGQKAEKKFNDALPEEEQVAAVLKGKKAEKPPNMPEFGSKGITEEDAKALIGYMKGLKTAN